jgi:hypothetical protein
MQSEVVVAAFLAVFDDRILERVAVGHPPEEPTLVGEGDDLGRHVAR